MGRRKLSRAAAPLSVLLCFGAVSLAQPGSSWEYLGDSHVDGSQDHDYIKVTAAKGEFKAIRLSVENAAIEFDRVVVHFGDGNAVPISIRSKIRPGAETRPIDLPGRQRIIDSVEVWYRRGNPANSEKPHLLLYGRS
jgi:hypothetical protein